MLGGVADWWAISGPPVTAATATHAAAAALALTFAYSLMQLPVQLSDSLEQLLNAQRSTSALASFVAWAQQGAYLRPLFFAEVKALFDLAGGHYWLVFRGFHALLICAAIALFIRALRVRTWEDFAAAIFALTVLTGLHTFRGLVREAFPVNHYLQVVVLCLVALNLARSRGGWMVDAAAALTFVVASLTLESGLLVWVVIVAGWWCGMPGVSRRGVAATTALVGLYAWARFSLLSVGTPGFEERSSGFLLEILDAEDIQQRFGGMPLVFYAYNVATSFLSVLFTDPDGGMFELVRAWVRGDVPPRLYLAVVSSSFATALIAWSAVASIRRRSQGMAHEWRQLLAVAGAVIACNAAISYVYTKHEILSVAGCFYAIAAFAAARHALERVAAARGWAVRLAIVIFLASAASLWAFRSLGVHHMLRVQAFKVRNDWAGTAPDMWKDPSDGPNVALVRQLRRDAIEMRANSPYLAPRWVDRWLGE